MSNKMSTQHTPGQWLVNYYNPATGKRHTLIDNIDEATADAVMRRFGPGGDPYLVMPDARKERVAQCVNCGGTFASTSLDPDFKGQCECAKATGSAA